MITQICMISKETPLNLALFDHLL